MFDIWVSPWKKGSSLALFRSYKEAQSGEDMHFRF